VSLAWGAYRSAAVCLGALAPAARAFAPPAERALWSERLGRVAVPGGVHAWIHAASMGEALAAGALLGELRRLQPGSRFQLTATTRAGRGRLAELDGAAALAPFDTPQAVRRFLAGVHPARIFLLETELWPHWLLRARSERIPVAVVSARLSARSVTGYLRFGAGLRDLAAGLAAVLCQSEEDRQRWLAIGSPPDRTAVVGNLKDDALPEPAADRGAARAGLGLDPARPLLVLGNLRPGEIRLLARAWLALPAGVRETWQVMAVPRHAAASEALQREARRARQPLVRGGAPGGGAWRWEDAMGVLRRCYAAAEVAFVGGTLAPLGGHNPLEPAACGAAVVIGPHHQSQAAGIRALRAGEAVWEADTEAQLVLALATLLGEPASRSRRGAAALEVAAGLRGAAARAVARLEEWRLWPAA
jgi:3-deoxy-D-manno-octulosonic-acid transferase